MKLKRNKKSRNWYAVWKDERGIERQRSTNTPLKKLAGEIGAKWEADAQRVREGLIDPMQLVQRDAARKPIGDHLGDYLAWCRNNGQSPAGLRTKETQIRAFIRSASCAALRDVTPAALERFMGEILGAGRAPRTANLHRMNVVAFMNWCRDYRRIASHDLTRRTVPKRDEARDCRRKRRALTVDELDRLRMASLPTGRWWTYQLAVWTGLRRGELGKLRWSDVDLEAGELHVRATISKNGQTDCLPIGEQARESLEALRRLHPDAELVVPRVPCDETLYRDLELAGIQGRTSTGACLPNDAGERVDFHALRATFATMLVRAGVAPLQLKRLMRHGNVAMTDRHYTKLRTSDLRAALELAVARPVELAATGTETLTPKLTPATATFGAQRGTTRDNGRGGISISTARASGGAQGNYVQLRTTGNDHALASGNHGPVAQRPTGIRGNPAGNCKATATLTPKLTPSTASDPALELLVAALSPAARNRLRALLGAG